MYVYQWKKALSLVMRLKLKLVDESNAKTKNDTKNVKLEKKWSRMIRLDSKQN